MHTVTRTPGEILKCQATLLEKILQLLRILIERKEPIRLQLPDSVPGSGRLSLVCPPGMTELQFLQALTDVFVATSKAVARKRPTPKKPKGT